MKYLFISRGVPGAGKNTLGEAITQNVVSADDYFEVDGEYKFDPSKIKNAHAYCKRTVRSFMEQGEDVAVANTFTRKWEMEDYFQLAEEFGYMVFSLIAENRHGGQNVHGVPAETVQKMKERFEVQL